MPLSLKFECKYKGFLDISVIFVEEFYNYFAMIIYNTTFHIDKESLSDGLEFLKKTYIPRAIAGGLLTDPRLSRVLAHEAEGESYALQFRVNDTGRLNRWLEQTGRALQNELVSRFGEKITGFSTLLEEMDWQA